MWGDPIKGYNSLGLKEGIKECEEMAMSVILMAEEGGGRKDEERC